MPNMPAFCSSCGLAFSSGIVIENSTGVSLSGVTSQCPRCGGIGQVPDGIYNVLGQVVQLLAGPGSSVEHLRRLKATFEAARDTQQGTEDLRKAVLATAPELTGLASALPTTRNELYTFITVVLTLLTLLVTAYAAFKPSGPSQSEIDAMVQKALSQAGASTTNTGAKRQGPKKAKVGRNEACPCGSGRKYKRCCA
jgi:SEC-C motif